MTPRILAMSLWCWSAFVGLAQEPPASVPADAVPVETLPAEPTPPEFEAIPGEVIVAEDGTLIMSPTNPEEAICGSMTCTIDDFSFDFPGWYARADAVWLNRSTQGETTTATLRNNNGLLGNNRLSSTDFDLEPGTRVFIGRNIIDGMTYLEAGFAGLNHWNNETRLATTAVGGIIETNIDTGFGTDNVFPDLQTIEYSSNLSMADLNIRSFFSPSFAFVGGLRYINLSESLVIFEGGTASLVPPGGGAATSFNYANDRTTTVGNNLLLPQMGFDRFREITDDIRLGTFARIGVGPNFSESTVRQRRMAEDPITGLNFNNARVQYDEETIFSGMVDLSTSVDILLTRNILLRGGFQFMWLYGVALAPEQHVNDILDSNGAQRQIENGADAILWGPFVGVEIYWGGVRD